MRTVVAILSCIFVAVLVSCITSQEVTSFWRAPEESPRNPHKSVFVVAMTANRAARSVLESDLAAAAAGYGLETVRSVDAFPNMFTGETRPSNEEMLAKAKASGCDAIFTLSLLDVKSEQRYVEGTTMGGYTPHFDYYGRFTGYWTHTYPVVATPGYYVTDETYFVEANLFDVATEKILWSMQSAAYNPKDINDFSKKYTRLLVERLEEENKTAGTK